MQKELEMYNPIQPIWVAKIEEIKEVKAVEAKKAVKAVKAKPAVLDKDGKVVTPAVEAVKASKAVEAVEAANELITEEGYENYVVSKEFMKENDPQPGMYYFTTAGGEKTGIITEEELIKNYKKV